MLYNIPDTMQVMGVKERLTEFIQFKNISKSKFERHCGLANGLVSSIGESIRPDTLDKVSKVYPDLSRSWLMLGEGEMIIGTRPEEAPPDKTETKIRDSIESQLKIQMLKDRISEVTEKYEATLMRIAILEHEMKKKA